MPPPLQRFGGGPNSLTHYGQYPQHPQTHPSGLSQSLNVNHSFINPNSNINPFSNGNALSLGQGFSSGGGGIGAVSGTGLASHAAQIGFAHGATLQQQAQQHVMAEQGGRGTANKNRIREVWKGDLLEEMETLRRLVDKYPYISMDTEFPGLVARPMGAFRGKSDYHYQTLRSNVDLLKLIQLGITIFNEDGETTSARPQSLDSGIDTNVSGARKYANTVPQLPCTWQFNFKFSLRDDMYSQDSIDSLQQTGLDFQRLESDGIDPFDFGALLISSGLVCDEDVKWISFHGGYDFGYLTKLMTCKPLPDDEVEFDMVMKKFFPAIYDVKFLMKYTTKLHQLGQYSPPEPAAIDMLVKFEQKQNLENLAEVLKVKRQGSAHQAGSDSLLTGKVFFQMRDRIFNGDISHDHLGHVWGLGGVNDLGLPMYTQPNSLFNTHLELSESNNNTQGQNGNPYANGVPTTPQTGHVGLASTPGPTSNSSMGMAPLTPGGGGGVFGQFQFAKP